MILGQDVVVRVRLEDTEVPLHGTFLGEDDRVVHVRVNDWEIAVNKASIVVEANAA